MTTSQKNDLSLFQVIILAIVLISCNNNRVSDHQNDLSSNTQFYKVFYLNNEFEGKILKVKKDNEDNPNSRSVEIEINDTVPMMFGAIDVSKEPLIDRIKPGDRISKKSGESVVTVEQLDGAILKLKFYFDL